MQREEAAIQRAVVQHLSLRAPSNSTWFAVPNGGPRNPIAGRLLKLEGVRAGVPDLILVRDGHPWGLELKKPKGRLSEAQLKFQQEWMNAGASWLVAYGLDDALYQLKGVGFL